MCKFELDEKLALFERQVCRVTTIGTKMSAQDISSDVGKTSGVDDLFGMLAIHFSISPDQTYQVSRISRETPAFWSHLPLICRIIKISRISSIKFDQLILTQMVKIVAARCHILRLKCTKFDFGCVLQCKALRKVEEQLQSVKRQLATSRTDSLVDYISALKV